MDTRQVRFAILGCGRISQIHMDAIENSPNAKLVAICDIIEERAEELIVVGVI